MTAMTSSEDDVLRLPAVLDLAAAEDFLGTVHQRLQASPALRLDASAVETLTLPCIQIVLAGIATSDLRLRPSEAFSDAFRDLALDWRTNGEAEGGTEAALEARVEPAPEAAPAPAAELAPAPAPEPSVEPAPALANEPCERRGAATDGGAGRFADARGGPDADPVAQRGSGCASRCQPVNRAKLKSVR